MSENDKKRIQVVVSKAHYHQLVEQAQAENFKTLSEFVRAIIEKHTGLSLNEELDTWGGNRRKE